MAVQAADDITLHLPEEGLYSAVGTLSNHVSDVTCMASNHQYFCSGSLDRTVRVFRNADFSEVTVLTHHTYHVRALDFSPCGRYLVTCASDGFAMVFDTESSPPFTRVGQCQHPSRCDMRVVTFAFPQGERIATAGDDGTICVWAFSPQCAPELSLLSVFGDTNEAVHACRFVPHHDDLLISGSSAGDLRLWRLVDVGSPNESSGAKFKAKCHLYIPTTHDLGVTSMDVVARRDDPAILMATGGHDNVISLWQIEPKPAESPSLRLICSRRDHNQSILSLKFTRHDSSALLLASTSIDPTVVVYAIHRVDLAAARKTGNRMTHEVSIVQRISDHSRYVNCAIFSPDASLLFTGSNDHTIRAYGMNRARGQVQVQHEQRVQSNPKLVVALPPPRRALALSSSIPHETKFNNCPAEFVCPITQELMTDPVIACDGYTYEREAITSWFRRGEVTSPMTNMPLSHTNLIPNMTLRSMLQRYVEEIDAGSLNGSASNGV